MAGSSIRQISSDLLDHPNRRAIYKVERVKSWLEEFVIKFLREEVEKVFEIFSVF